MRSKESAGEFYHRFTGNNSAEPGKFNVYRIEDFEKTTPLPHYRRDFYKISLLTKGSGILAYADKTYKITGSVLTFSNPMIPYSWEPIAKDEEGYFCLFTESFLTSDLTVGGLARSPLFGVGGNHVLFPEADPLILLKGIFEQMLRELHTGYENKYDLLRNYVRILIHEGLKIEPVKSGVQTVNSAARISNLFLELLERQFPIASPGHVLQFKSPRDFAEQLAVHINYLNRVVKQTTGKTTTAHITDRIIREARSLLLHSDWDIAEIGYCLGFDYGANFTIYFKKHTGESPGVFRRQAIANS